MKKLSRDQRRVLSEAVSNIGVAWFAGGVVASMFTSKTVLDMIGPSLWGTVLATLFISFGVSILKK